MSDTFSHGEIAPELLPRLEACAYVQTVPKEWGRVIRFEHRKGKLVAHTESGNVVIVRK
jgi:hypothetical protein